jgi:hypothetical protein
LSRKTPVRRAYVQGLLQRRVKYRFDLPAPTSIKSWLAEARQEVRTLLERDWGAVMCPEAELPSLGMLLVEWRGAHLPADVSICAPVSHPRPPPLAYDVPVERVDVCVEPIAPVFPPAEYIAIHIPSVKTFGRISLRRNYAVVKHRGLLFVTEARHGPEPRGGVELLLARYNCASYDLGEALKKLKRILRARY